MKMKTKNEIAYDRIAEIISQTPLLPDSISENSLAYQRHARMQMKTLVDFMCLWLDDDKHFDEERFREMSRRNG